MEENGNQMCQKKRVRHKETENKTKQKKKIDKRKWLTKRQLISMEKKIDKAIKKINKTIEYR